MKVCIVYTCGLSTRRGGGIATKIKNIIKKTSSEIDYTIVTSFEKGDHAEIKFFNDLGVDVFGASLSSNSMLDCFRFLGCSPNLKFDVIHFHELPFAWNLRSGLSTGLSLLKPNFWKAALVYEHQIATLGNLNPIHQAWQYTCFKALFPVWRKVIVNTKYMLSEALRLVVRSGTEKMKLVPLGLDLEEIQSSPILNLEGPSLLFFGHFSAIKGTDILMKAFLKVSQRNREVHLHLFGDGPLRGFCEDFARKTNLSNRVHFWGAQSQHVLFGAIKGADICVLPSRNDAGPFSVLEAMAAGKPLVTTMVGGIPEYVKSGRNGLLVKPDSYEVANAIECLLDDSRFRREIGGNNLQDIQNHSLAKISQEYVNVYRSLIA